MDHRVTVPPEGSGRRSINLPAVALIAAILVIFLGVLAWHIARRRDPSAWNHGEITARFVDLTVRQGQKNVHLFLRYNLANNTGKAWSMPPPTLGTLMRRLPDGALHEVDSVQWDAVTIPAGKTAEVTFELLIDSTKEETPPEKLPEAGTLNVFANRHLRRIQGLVFLDYRSRESINLPRGWDSQTPPQQTNPE